MYKFLQSLFRRELKLKPDSVTLITDFDKASAELSKAMSTLAPEDYAHVPLVRYFNDQADIKSINCLSSASNIIHCDRAGVKNVIGRLLPGQLNLLKKFPQMPVDQAKYILMDEENQFLKTDEPVDIENFFVKGRGFRSSTELVNTEQLESYAKFLDVKLRADGFRGLSPKFNLESDAVPIAIFQDVSTYWHVYGLRQDEQGQLCWSSKFPSQKVELVRDIFDHALMKGDPIPGYNYFIGYANVPIGLSKDYI